MPSAALERTDKEYDFSVSIEALDDVVSHDPAQTAPRGNWHTKDTIDVQRESSRTERGG
jgi:hypothetical protein